MAHYSDSVRTQLPLIWVYISVSINRTSGSWWGLEHAELETIKTHVEEAITEGDFHPNGDLPFDLTGSGQIFEDFCNLHCIPYHHPEAKLARGKHHVFRA